MYTSGRNRSKANQEYSVSTFHFLKNVLSRIHFLRSSGEPGFFFLDGVYHVQKGVAWLLLLMDHPQLISHIISSTPQPSKQVINTPPGGREAQTYGVYSAGSSPKCLHYTLIA